MSPQKLSDTDKQEIIELYRTTPETTSTLAERYGVSSSTISRFLKNSFSESEHKNLIQQKRLIARTGLTEEPKEDPEIIQETEENNEVEPEAIEENRQELVDMMTLNEMLGEDLEDLEDEDDYGDDEDWEEQTADLETQILTHGRPQIEVLPLSDAYLPKVCYVVIDRFAELITRPLQEFADLGKIPSTEIQQKTLPIFDNQRVARRFSNRSQRVIKVPDGRLFKKTSGYLKAKGITRLLIDGQVYAC